MTLLATNDPDQGVWVDDTTVAVMKGSPSDAVTPELLFLTSSQPQKLAPWPGLTALSAGNGGEEIYAQSTEGIFQRIGNGLVPAAQGPDRSFLSGLAVQAGTAGTLRATRRDGSWLAGVCGPDRKDRSGP